MMPLCGARRSRFSKGRREERHTGSKTTKNDCIGDREKKRTIRARGPTFLCRFIPADVWPRAFLSQKRQPLFLRRASSRVRVRCRFVKHIGQRGVWTESWTSHTAHPRRCLYSIRLSPPNDSLMRVIPIDIVIKFLGKTVW